MTNIVRKGQQRWMRNTFTKKRAAHTSYICFAFHNGTTRQQCLLHLAVAFQSYCPFLSSVILIFSKPSALSCVYAFTCAAVATLTPPYPLLPRSLVIVPCPSYSPEISSTASFSSQPAEAEQCRDEHPECNKDGKH